MGFIRRIIQAYKQKVEQRNAVCQTLLDTTIYAIAEMDSFLASSEDFLDLRQSNSIIENQAELRTALLKPLDTKLKKAVAYHKLIAVRNDYNHKVAFFQQFVSEHNERIAQKKLPDAYRVVGDVEGRKLDSQQMMCVLKDAYSHLVIAGAGTGKTTTIIGKIKFLLKKKLCEPQDILVLSFTNASAAEMKERIRKETDRAIEAITFHKLGLNIIKECAGIVPKITQISLRSFVKEQLSLLMEQPRYLQLLSNYFLYHGVVAKSEFEFASEIEYSEYLENNPPTTLKKERVKSYGELDIANFLLQNGIVYEYEAAYPIDTRTSEYGQYHPDFFLPEYNIYIEYFGINQNGEVPAYFSEKNGKSATTTYKDSMEWKRRLHIEQGTTLIECFSYEKFSDNLLENLEIQLKNHHVDFHPKSSKELWDELISSGGSALDGFVELAETVINLMKSNGYSIQQARDRIPANSSETASNFAILSLIEPVYTAYCDILAQRTEIDFNDMINVATQYVSERKYLHRYKYVIVDEYQDISKSRYLLLKAMRDTNDYSLFCVGDDWQSIYRFAGSDVGFILNFTKYWGPSEISRIETTYRFPQTLIDISAGFMMKNPNQVQKSIHGNVAMDFPLGEINGYTENNLADFLATRLLDLPQNSTVFLIGRYSFDVDYIKNSPNFSCHYNNTVGHVSVVLSHRKDLQISFITAHRSKGLQADFVFILNNKKSRMGFPSKIQDAPILNLLLDNSDSFPYAEERRLFYVVLTRAKEKVILLTLNGRESEFVIELQATYGNEMRREAFTCPLCGGTLVKRSGPYGEFFGCANYRSQDCKYKRVLNKKQKL